MTRECHVCGREFDGARGIGQHMNHQHDGKPWIPKEKLERLYYEEGLNQHEIADKLDCTQRVIQKAMLKYNLETPKATNDPTRPPNHRFHRQSDQVGTEYEIIQTKIDYELYSFYIHRLIAVAHGKLDPSDMWDRDTVVHHKSEHGLDNRPENLKAMERGDHQTMHMEERHGA